MSNADTTAQTPTAPAWAVETERGSDGWEEDVTIHRGETHQWGYTSVQLERGDFKHDEGLVEVKIIVPTESHPDGEDIMISLPGAAELMILLDKVVGELTAAEGAHEFYKLCARRTPPVDASSTVRQARLDETSVVDARFAGGSIVVEPGEFVDQKVVNVEFPGSNPVPLRPHEAQALAAALIAHAEASEVTD